MKTLSEAEYRTELRATNKRLGRHRLIWELLNMQTAQLAETIQSPFDMLEKAAKRPASVEKAEIIAHPYGSALDVLLEQAEYWCWRRDNQHIDPHLHFLHLRHGQRKTIELSAQLAGLEPVTAMAISMRAKGKSYRQIADKLGIGRNTAARIWSRTIGALNGEECPCHNAMCSMNDHADRQNITEEINALSYLHKPRPDRVAHSMARRTVKCSVRRVETMPTPLTVPDDAKKLPVENHRWQWTNRHGRIPFEHDVHHVTRDKTNDAVDALQLMPRYVHRMMCGNA